MRYFFQFFLKKYLKNLKKTIDNFEDTHYTCLVSYEDTSKQKIEATRKVQVQR